jgi:hypothetical protein
LHTVWSGRAAATGALLTALSPLRPLGFFLYTGPPKRPITILVFIPLDSASGFQHFVFNDWEIADTSILLCGLIHAGAA